MILLTEPFAIFFLCISFNVTYPPANNSCKITEFSVAWSLASSSPTNEGHKCRNPGRFWTCHCDKSPLFLQTEMSCSLERLMCDDYSSDDSQSVITSFIQFKCRPHQESSMHHIMTTQFNNSVINYICTSWNYTHLPATEPQFLSGLFVS